MRNTSQEEEERQISGEERVKEFKLERGRVLGRRWRREMRVQWVEETGRRVRNRLIFLLLTTVYQPPRCKSDCQMDPGEVCC